MDIVARFHDHTKRKANNIIYCIYPLTAMRKQLLKLQSMHMEALSFVLCLLLTCALLQALRWVVTRGNKANSGKLPPGPVPFPVIGNLLALGEKPHRSLAELAKTYGPLMSLKLGRVLAVVVSSADIAKQVLQTHDLVFSHRTTPDSVLACDHGELSVVFISPSTRWKTLRNICHSHLFSGKKLDEGQHLRRRELKSMLRTVQESAGAGFDVDIGETAFKTSLNLLSNTFFSVDLVGRGSDSAQEFKQLVWNIMEEAGRPNLADFFPKLSKWDLQGRRRRMTIYLGRMLGLFNTMIRQRLESRKRAGPGSSDSKYVLDTLLNINEEGGHNLEEGWIEHLLLDLFIGGTESSSSTVEWAMAELLRNPEKLHKAQVELRDTIGIGNPVEEWDLDSLPYLHAIVKETMRLHPPAPFLVPRKCDEDTEICGFRVPKGAQVLVNVWKIGRDPSLWENPLCFDPERFLESDIDVKGRNFELLPFGSGRRICMGIPLAMRTVPLMLSSLLHFFDWKLPGGSAPEDMNMEEKFGFAMRKAEPLRAVPTTM